MPRPLTSIRICGNYHIEVYALSLSCLRSKRRFEVNLMKGRGDISRRIVTLEELQGTRLPAHIASMFPSAIPDAVIDEKDERILEKLRQSIQSYRSTTQ